jgi:hypothetical protein
MFNASHPNHAFFFAEWEKLEGSEAEGNSFYLCWI